MVFLLPPVEPLSCFTVSFFVSMASKMSWGPPFGVSLRCLINGAGVLAVCEGLNMIPIAETSLGEEELNNIKEAVESGWISSKGKFIPEFEEKFSGYCGVKYGVATSSGTAALHLALAALGIKGGDEVIIPTLSFVATANAIKYTGAKPVFVDSHPNYWCIDPAKIEEAVTPRTRAIIPVHLYGHPCDMDPIMDIAQRHSLYVIEDAAEGHGADYKGKKAGSFGNVSCFSFYGNKIITTGEGGMCLTDDEELAGKMRVLRDHGMNPNRRYWHDVVGFNYRMTNLQAAVGAAQVGKLDEFMKKKRQIASWYAEALRELEVMGLIKLHCEMPWAKCVYWMYSITVEVNRRVKISWLMEKLRGGGIETRPFFVAINLLPPYRSETNFPIAEALSEKGLSLPSGVTLTKNDVERVSGSIRQFVR